jgi:hypothetical protein
VREEEAQEVAAVKHVVLMYTDPATTKAMSTEELDEVLRKHEALRNELTASGELVGGDGLDLPEETTTMRWQDGGVVTVAGPFAEGDEQLSAYYVIDCADRERALAIAERVLDFHVIAVEVRHVHDSA